MKNFQTHVWTKMPYKRTFLCLALAFPIGITYAQFQSPLLDFDVITLAGSSTNVSGSINGSGTNARFNFPNGITMDANDNLYVCDTDNNMIRKVSVKGVVSTFAGATTSGTQNGTGIAARFNSPRGIVRDNTSGNLYVADANNHCIRKITPTGSVSTFAGTPTVAGNTNGTANAKFNLPSGITIDGAGNLYVSDMGNNLIRKISPQGAVTTLAGGSQGILNFNQPQGITIDASGNLYVADAGNNMIKKVDPQGNISVIAGAITPGYVDSTSNSARFNRPVGISVTSSGTLFVTDEHNYAIRKITPIGKVTTVSGLGPSLPGHIDGPKSVAKFENPRGIVAKSDGKTIFVTDNSNHCIRKLMTISVGPVIIKH